MCWYKCTGCPHCRLNKIPWLTPDFWSDWNFPDFFPDHGHPELQLVPNKDLRGTYIGDPWRKPPFRFHESMWVQYSIGAHSAFDYIDSSHIGVQWVGVFTPCGLYHCFPGMPATETELWLEEIREWISNYIPYTVWDKITYPFPNFNGTQPLEVWEWISNTC